MTLLLSWDPRGRRCVVVGGGRVGARRARDLVEAGGSVLVVAPAFDDSLELLAAERSEVTLSRQAVNSENVEHILEGSVLVVVATNDPLTNQLVGSTATGRGALVNRADQSDAGDVTWTTAIRRGPAQVAVSTGGAAPAVARFVADQIDNGLDGLLGLNEPQLTDLIAVFGEVRRSVRAAGRSPAPIDWRSEQAATILDLIRSGRAAEAKERLLSWQSS